MGQPVTLEEILPLVVGLTPQDRARLIRLIAEQPDADDAEVYRSKPPMRDEFSDDEESLEWDADGWEESR